MNIIAQTTKLNIKYLKQTIINDIDLNFYANKIHVLIGRSGSGKTTLLRAINRLNEEIANYKTTGEIKVDFGKGLIQILDNSKIDLANLRRNIGMVFQNPHILPISIWRNLILPLEKLTSLSKQEIKLLAEHSLMDVGLWDEVKDRLQDSAESLSGGQQQRLCLARTLALEPKILLLDEPTASLDAISSKNIEDLLLKLKNKYTIIMVSHSLSQAKKLADYLVVLEEGKINKILAKDNEESPIDAESLLSLL